MQIAFNTFSQHLRSPATQLAYGAALSTITHLFLRIAPLHSAALGFGLTAIFVAMREHQDLKTAVMTPIPMPAFKYNLDSFTQPVPWKVTFNYCAHAINVCGGVFLLTQFATAPLLLPCMSLGIALRLFQNTNAPNGPISISLAAFACRLLHYGALQSQAGLLSSIVGYFSCSLVLDSCKR